MTKTVEQLIKESNLTEAEIKLLLNSKKPALKKRPFTHRFGRKHAKIGVIADPHVGSKYFREDAFDAARRKFNSEGVDAIYIPGDILEGMSGRDGHIYTLEDIGYSAQMDHAVDLLNQLQQPTFFITGNHDDWGKNKANAGLKVGPDLERRVKGSTFLGEMEATVYLAPNVRMDLTHRGNTAYALSYAGQKRINALPDDNKPNIILNGHLHKAIYMNYRNINYVEAGTLQDQTDFMAMKGSPAHVGFWIIDIEYGKQGLTGFNPCWYSLDHGTKQRAD